jgi:hypothetical protein
VVAAVAASEPAAAAAAAGRLDAPGRHGWSRPTRTAASSAPRATTPRISPRVLRANIGLCASMYGLTRTTAASSAASASAPGSEASIVKADQVFETF